jgi:hypothetical protein
VTQVPRQAINKPMVAKVGQPELRWVAAEMQVTVVVKAVMEEAPE